MPGFGRNDYAGMLQVLMPPGGAWRGPVTAELIDVVAGELARVDARLEALLEEADPRRALELLDDWERDLALPGPCAAPAETLRLRREQAHQALTGRGGQSRAWFVALAARLGYAITIEELAPFRVGVSSVADPLYGEDWTWVWRVRAPAETIRYFRVGHSTVAEPLSVVDSAVVSSARVETWFAAVPNTMFLVVAPIVMSRV